MKNIRDNIGDGASNNIWSGIRDKIKLNVTNFSYWNIYDSIDEYINDNIIWEVVNKPNQSIGYATNSIKISDSLKRNILNYMQNEKYNNYQ